MRSVVFITNDSSLFRQLLRAVNDRWILLHAGTKKDALEMTVSGRCDAILVDPVLRCCNGKHLLSHLVGRSVRPPVFIATRQLCVLFHDWAYRLGVAGYHVLPGGISRLVSAVDGSWSSGAHCEHSTGYVGDIPGGFASSLQGSAAVSFLGISAASMRVRQTVHKYCNSLEPVLIYGESGSGKELVSRMVHENSPVKDGPFVPVNASCFCDSLADSQFFGTVKGAFTGAENTAGVFEHAHGGTLFLDEVSELHWTLQAKLLRILEDGQITRLGSSVARTVSVRIICATNRNLSEMINKRLFRADLFYRLDVLRLEIPPLRDRLEDIPVLARFVLEKKKKELSPAAASRLRGYHWPGNVRQLFHCLERAASESTDRTIYPDHLDF